MRKATPSPCARAKLTKAMPSIATLANCPATFASMPIGGAPSGNRLPSSCSRSVWLKLKLPATAPGCENPNICRLLVTTGSGDSRRMVRVPPPGMAKSISVSKSDAEFAARMASRSVQCAALQTPSLVSASEFTTINAACAGAAASKARASQMRITGSPVHRG